jgi:hypothetical protein
MPVPLLYLVTAFLLNMILVLLYRVIRNVRWPIEINSNGIRSKHNFWFWSQVESISALLISGNYRITIGLRIRPRNVLLHDDSPLTQDQCDALIDNMKPFLTARHPTVRLNWVHG